MRSPEVGQMQEWLFHPEIQHHRGPRFLPYSSLVIFNILPFICRILSSWSQDGCSSFQYHILTKQFLKASSGRVSSLSSFSKAKLSQKRFTSNRIPFTYKWPELCHMPISKPITSKGHFLGKGRPMLDQKWGSVSKKEREEMYVG